MKHGRRISMLLAVPGLTASAAEPPASPVWRTRMETAATVLETQPDDLDARWIVNVAAMKLGEYPDLVDPRWLIPPKAFASDHAMPSFMDVAAAAGVDTPGPSGGLTLADLDGDSYLDILSSSGYFRNERTGTFSDRTAEAGLVSVAGAFRFVPADYDNDGHLDVLVLGPSTLLLRNLGDGTFTDVSEAAGVRSRWRPSHTAAWADFNHDGWLDLALGDGSLYRNNRDATFSACAATLGLEAGGTTERIAWGDYDNDGDPDLFRSGRLHRNDGPGQTFVDVTGPAGIAETRGSTASFLDYDNDGWLDLLVVGGSASAADIAASYLGLDHSGATPSLYRNDGDGTFTDVTADAGLDRPMTGGVAGVGDLDNDGYLDLYVATSELMPSLAFRNDGAGRFQDVTEAGGFGTLERGTAVTFGDVDNDGDQDVYAVLADAPNLLLENPGSRNRWLTIVLEGEQTNRGGLGARVHVRVKDGRGERDIYRVVNGQLEVGLGPAQLVRFVKVTWPVSGLTQTFEQLALDRVMKIREGIPVPIIETRPRVPLGN